jgi:hypothetical protein
VRVVRNAYTYCGQNTELLFLKQVVRAVTTEIERLKLCSVTSCTLRCVTQSVFAFSISTHSLLLKTMCAVLQEKYRRLAWTEFRFFFVGPLTCLLSFYDIAASFSFNSSDIRWMGDQSVVRPLRATEQTDKCHHSAGTRCRCDITKIDISSRFCFKIIS